MNQYNICLLSIGGSSIPYGNIFNDSKKYGNFNIEYLSSFLESKNIYSTILYCNFSDSPETIEKQLIYFDVIIVFVDYLNNDKIISIFNILKNNNAKLITVGFGTYVDNNYKELIETNSFNFLCLGNPMISIYEMLVNDFSMKLAYKNSYIVSKNNFENKKKDTFYLSNIIPSYNYYLLNNINKRYKTYILSTRNNVCFGRCTFCLSKNGKYLYKSSEVVLAEIKQLVAIGIKDFLINDNDFFEIWEDENNKKRIIDIFTGLLEIKEKITISCFAKSRTINLIEDKFLLLFKKAGLFCIFVGVDAGNDDDKIIYNKGSSLIDDKIALMKLTNLNIFARIGFIMLNPFSSLKSLKENYYFLTQIKSLNIYQYGKLKLLMFKGTEIYDKIKENKLIINEGKNVYDYSYLNKNIVEIVKFLDFFFDKLDSNSKYYPFISFKRIYEEAKFLSPTIMKRYYKEVKRLESEEFEDIKNFFYYIYEKNDLSQALFLMNNFIEKICIRSERCKRLSNKFEEIIKEAKYHGISA